MAIFPGAKYTPRTIANVPGNVYDATKPTHFYAEDLNKTNDEVVAIENTLGVNPQGAYATVRAWLDAIQAALAGGTGFIQGTEVPTGAVDDANVSFGVAHEPKYIVVNGSQYALGEGVYSGYAVGIITLSSAVGVGGFIRSYF